MTLEYQLHIRLDGEPFAGDPSDEIARILSEMARRAIEVGTGRAETGWRALLDHHGKAIGRQRVAEVNTPLNLVRHPLDFEV